MSSYPKHSGDVGVSEPLALLQGEQDVNKVTRLSSGDRLATVLLDDAVHEAGHPRHELGAPRTHPLRVERGEPREVVAPVLLAQELVPFVHHLEQLLHLLLPGRRRCARHVVLLAEHEPHDVVERRAPEEAAHLDGARAGGAAQRRDDPLTDARAVRREGLDLPGAEQVPRRDAPERAPVRAVLGEANGAVEHEAVGGVVERTVGERRAVEDLLGHVRVGRDDGADGAERHRHEPLGPRPARRLVGQRAVRQAGHEAEAADDREPSRPWDRRRLRARPPCPPVLAPCRATWVSPVEQGRACPCKTCEDGEVSEASGYGGNVVPVLLAGDGRDQGHGKHPPALN
jgi:hypothetical protein